MIENEKEKEMHMAEKRSMRTPTLSHQGSSE